MVGYPLSGFIILSLMNLKCYEDRGPDMRTGEQGKDNPKNPKWK